MGDEHDGAYFDDENLVKPTQQSLDVLARHVNTIRVCDWEVIGQEIRPRVLLTVDDRKRIDELLRHIEIVESDDFFHCMCIGSLLVQFVTTEGLVATLGLHHGKAIRWDDAWDSDAQLYDGWGLARWLARQGVTSLLEEMERTEREAAQVARDFASWHAAMPLCLASLYVPSPCEPSPFLSGAESVAHLLPALKAGYDTESRAILALCEWHGTLGSAWNPCNAYEVLPHALLDAFGSGRVLAALERRCSRSVRPKAPLVIWSGTPSPAISRHEWPPSCAPMPPHGRTRRRLHRSVGFLEMNTNAGSPFATPTFAPMTVAKNRT